MMYYLTDDDFKEAAKNGISYERVYARYYAEGWDRQRAITEPVRKPKGLWTKYKAISVVAEPTFYYRIKKGWEPEKAALTPPNNHIKPKISAEQYKQAEANGIGRNTLHNRVFYCKWSIEDAITIPVIKDHGKRRKGHGVFTGQ